MSGSKKLSIEQRLRRFPPIVCRLLAREGRGSRPVVLSDATIAERSGLTVAQVQGLSHLLTWDDVSCAMMVAFSSGCGVNLSERDSMHKHWCYVKGKRAFTFLKKEPDYETRWKPMYASYVGYLRSKHDAKTSSN
jgi:hypothetical protein